MEFGPPGHGRAFLGVQWRLVSYGGDNHSRFRSPRRFQIIGTPENLCFMIAIECPHCGVEFL
jgi:hypothetical protein